MNRDQRDHVARGEAGLAGQSGSLREGATGVGRLVDDDRHSPAFGAARKHRPFPRRDALLRAYRHRIHLVVTVRFEVGAKQRGEVGARRP